MICTHIRDIDVTRPKAHVAHVLRSNGRNDMVIVEKQKELCQIFATLTVTFAKDSPRSSISLEEIRRSLNVLRILANNGHSRNTFATLLAHVIKLLNAFESPASL